MIVEIENIFRLIHDQRQALLSLQVREITIDHAAKASEIEDMLNQLEFKVRDLNFGMEKVEKQGAEGQRGKGNS